jgi:hypothetical protein
MTNDEARAIRDELLTVSDWTQTPDAPLTENERLRWRQYRQILRDIPQQVGFPDSIVWPNEPDRDPVVASSDT